ncbi:YggL family protein [Lysobacter sp. KIS68-7]|uniref:YggL 50S ribosome-binding family protein n=1 Tax=Lysobacter sp. KIS68-7 TaxID=2904252 RepID=UPI001E5C439E|nr:50S ribosome-binding protein YggL [Lysobacter sp. KIS68-7]UHQ19520.1 YggL family protein [Lysobacter sp. KIS68-7]
MSQSEGPLSTQSGQLQQVEAQSRFKPVEQSVSLEYLDELEKALDTSRSVSRPMGVFLPLVFDRSRPPVFHCERVVGSRLALGLCHDRGLYGIFLAAMVNHSLRGKKYELVSVRFWPKADKCQMENQRLRSRRLRKKLHVGEFQQLGFAVAFKLVGDLTVDQSQLFWEAFIADAIEANRLTYGGAENGFVVPEGRESATEPHREVIKSWLSSRAEVSSADVGPLMDAWHGPGLGE